jgi:hypothetical protein
VAKLQKALWRKNRVMPYLRVIEWSRGRPHAHLLVRWEGDGDPGAGLRRVFQREERYRVTCDVIRDIQATARYVVKNLDDPGKQPELTPRDFRGRVIVASAKFLTKPLSRLWAEIQLERKKESVTSSAGVAS